MATGQTMDATTRERKEMEDKKVHVQSEAQVIERKAWDAPRIVLERSLLVSAQGTPPGVPQGFLGPLSGPSTMPCEQQ
jgi:hypothetical protein